MSQITLMTFLIVYSVNLAQDTAGIPSAAGVKYKTFTSCQFNQKLKIEVHQFPETGPRGAKQHIVAYIKNDKTNKWMRTRIYLPPTPILVENGKKNEQAKLRGPASSSDEKIDNSNIEVFYFKDDLHKPVKNGFPNIDSNAALVGIVQTTVNAPVSMLLKGYFHHWSWGPHSTNEKWSSYEPFRTSLKSVLLQKKFYEMAYTEDCTREYREI